MKFASLAAVVLAISPAFAQTVRVAFTPMYDEGDLPLSSLACPIIGDYTNLGSLPIFPYVGGVYTVTGSNSPACGQCYEVTYGDVTKHIIAVDTAGDGVNLSKDGMDGLTNGQAAKLGTVNATLAEVEDYFCYGA